MTHATELMYRWLKGLNGGTTLQCYHSFTQGFKRVLDEKEKEKGDLIQSSMPIDQPFDVKSSFTADLLDWENCTQLVLLVTCGAPVLFFADTKRRFLSSQEQFLTSARVLRKQRLSIQSDVAPTLLGHKLIKLARLHNIS